GTADAPLAGSRVDEYLPIVNSQNARHRRASARVTQDCADLARRSDLERDRLTRHDATRGSSQSAFDSPIQPFAPNYGPSSTAGAALPTRSTMTRSKSSSLMFLPSTTRGASSNSTSRPGEHITRVTNWSTSTVTDSLDLVYVA